MAESRVASSESAAFDVAVVGGGLVGASLAVALAPTGRRIALVEAAPLPRTAPAWDERTIALNVASRRIYENLGLWPALRAEAEPMVATHISERSRFGVTRITAQEAGEEALGYNLPVRAVGSVLWQRLAQCGNVEIVCPARLGGFETGDANVTLRLEQGRALTAKLVVAADGAQSAARRLLGIGAEERDYGQTAIIGAVRPERPHRNVAHERFTEDGPIAVLPRPGDRCALIWTVPTAKAADMLAWTDAEFLARLQEAFGLRLGRFVESGRRAGYPLHRVLADRITAPRVIFAGNAAQTLHPVAAQGFNLGLRDIATVAELLAAPGDPGAPPLLAEYAARRERDRGQVADFTDALVRIFSNAVPGLRAARHWGLLALDLLPPLKAAVTRQNIGFSGATPALARAESP